MKLLSYRFKMIVPFGDGEYRSVYELTIQKRYFFGILKKEVTIHYSISMYGSIKQHEKHWDYLITSGQPIL